MCACTLDLSNPRVAIAPAEYKRAGRQFASGVTVVTSRLGDVLHGATVSAFTRAAATGAPIVDNCLAFFDCTISSAVDSGDHTLFIGDVCAVEAANGAPLIYFDGAYRRLGFAGQLP